MQQNRTKTLVIGLVLILFSLVLLSRLITQLDATTQIVNYWPGVLVLIGVLSINPKNPSSNGVSLAIMGIGIFGVMIRTGIFQTPQGQAVLGIMLALVAIVVLAMAFAKPPSAKSRDHQPQQINKSNRL